MVLNNNYEDYKLTYIALIRIIGPAGHQTYRALVLINPTTTTTTSSAAAAAAATILPNSDQ